MATETLQDPDIQPVQAISICRRLTSEKELIGTEQHARLLRIVHSVIEGAADEDLKEQRAGFLVEYALAAENDPEKALVFKREAMPAKWRGDPYSLNSFAWWCHEHSINLDEAETLACLAVDLSTPGRDQANRLDTLAELVNQQGRPAEALHLIRRALDLNPSSGHLQGQVARFEELVGQ